MCKNERYKGEKGKKLLEEIAKKLKDAYNEDYIIQMASNGSYFLAKPDTDTCSS